MAELTFWVMGTPQPQGSIQYKGRTRAGKPILTSDNENLRPWRQAVAWVAQSKFQSRQPLEGAVTLELNFCFARPASHFGKKGLLGSAPPEHTIRPDLDKLIRAVKDSLADAGVIRNDSQVIHIRATKAYTTTAPGAAITVRQLYPSSQPAASANVTPQEDIDGSQDAGLRRALG